MTAPAMPPWTNLAGRALLHAVADRMDIAARCVERIAREHSPDVIPQVMLAWVDTAWARMYPDGIPDGYLDAPMRFWHEGDEHTESVDRVPPPVRWAGRFIVARLADDETQARALLSSVQSDEEWSSAVLSVLDVCAANVRLAAAVEGGDPTP
jgi:hypothetical protein